MQIGQAAGIDDASRVLEHVVRLGWKTGDQVGAEDDVRTQLTRPLAERDGIGAAVTPFHALQRQIVARLHREVQVRHQPLFISQRDHQIGIGFHLVDRREPQTRKIRHVL